ncbi:gluconate transporter [Streptomyces bomunensis]|uniref:Gluconate transporter n=1 Tax=Streptomyces montanisoli TaxID=2798581 RepID=A0A940MEW6_9ACTN|nr:gluconate transporter [Streptomyces montanisoli]
MTGHAWTLLIILAAAIAALILLINSRLRFHPFAALMTVSVGVALAAGEPVEKIADSLESGAGGILGNVGVTLAFGTMLGRLLSLSGATDRIARMIVDRAGTRSLPWYMTAAAFVIGIPTFFEIGLIVLLPLIFSVARRLQAEHDVKGSPYIYLATPAIAALATLHGMVAPHPGPLVAVEGLHANLGLTIGIGLICAIPTVIVAGPVYGRWIAPRLDVRPDPELIARFAGNEPAADNDATGTTGATGATGSGHGAGAPARRNTVRTGWALAAVLVPVALMLLRTLAELVCGEAGQVRHVLTFTGEPVPAMLAGFLFALFALGYRSGAGADEIRSSLTDSLKAVASILLIIAGGGAFNQVLEDSGIGKAVESAASGMHINVLLLGWLLALLLSFSTGSATVGIVAATGILAPVAGSGSSLHTALLVVAIGAGSIGLNYVNHAGFWLVKESFGMTLGQATKSHTAIQTIVSACGLLMALLISIWA